MLFTTTLPPALAAGVWDAFAADGSVVIMRVMVQLLRHLEPLLAGADQHATLMLLRGYARARSAAGEGLGAHDAALGSDAAQSAEGAAPCGEAAVEPPSDLIASLLRPPALAITTALVAALTRDAEAAVALAK